VPVAEAVRMLEALPENTHTALIEAARLAAPAFKRARVADAAADEALLDVDAAAAAVAARAPLSPLGQPRAPLLAEPAAPPATAARAGPPLGQAAAGATPLQMRHVPADLGGFSYGFAGHDGGLMEEMDALADDLRRDRGGVFGALAETPMRPVA
jgi:hypothetical protein